MGGLRFWKGDPTTKMKYIITKKKKIGPKEAQTPLGPHLGPPLYVTYVTYITYYQNSIKLISRGGAKGGRVGAIAPPELAKKIMYDILLLYLKVVCTIH